MSAVIWNLQVNLPGLNPARQAVRLASAEFAYPGGWKAELTWLVGYLCLAQTATQSSIQGVTDFFVQ